MLQVDVTERENNQRSHNATDPRKAAMTRVMTNINKCHMMCACQSFLSIIEAIIASEGS